MSNYFQPEIECASASEIRAMQSEKIVKQVKHVYDNVEYYRNLMDEKGVKPEDIQSIDDLHKLPFLTKADLRDAYPYGLLGVNLGECVRIHSTSGTTGRRVVAFYTQKDIDLWEDCCARAIVAAGGNKDDVCQVAYGYGLFTGGFGLNGGSQKVGCLTLPMSSGNTDRQLQFMTDLGTTVLCCTPSYAAYLTESVNERGLRSRIKLKAGIFGAEAWTEEMRRGIEEGLGIKAYDIYGLTEISGPGVAYECSRQHGMHVNEDHFIVETINPKTGEPVPRGQKGELVFTSITKEAFPLIRYRTKDIGILYEEPCPCGRTHVRMSKPMGRSDDMLIVKGVNVFPSQIETVLMNCGYPANYQIVVTRANNTDRIEVQVEMTPEMFSDSLTEVAGREKQLVSALKAMLGIYCVVKLVAPKSITRSEGKAKRVIDKRNLYENGAADTNSN
jgi:phenylacetate-CoA ligase